jgi:transposase
MHALTTTPSRFIGCDVGKASIAVYDSQDGRSDILLNQPEALATFVAGLEPGCLVVCEATGGHETALLHAVCQAGHAIHRADARKVKAFIRSHGTLGKTDALDARALSQYGQERHRKLTRWQSPDQSRVELQALVLARRDLVAQRVASGNRLTAPGADAVRPFFNELLACLKAQIAAVDARIKAIIRNHRQLQNDVTVLRSIVGLGEITAAALMALMPELGSLTRRQAAALAGLAPHPNQSGKTDAYRPIRGGRPEIKRVLFMAAIAAARHNPDIKPFYDNLIAKGKKPLVALTAVMRKIVVIANAKLRDAN